MTIDRKAFLSDPSLLAALGAHVRTRVPASDADDVLQSVIADALAAESAPDEADALKRWVYGVARNKIADFHRRVKRTHDLDDDAHAAPSSGREGAKDLLEWAENELPPGSDAKRTFEWMLREGDGEKLEAIAASEKLPAPRVRKRVSRMREHFRARWAAYVAALAAAGLTAIIVFYILRKKPEPEARVVPEVVTPSASAKAPIEQAREERERALEACATASDPRAWQECLEGLDRAAKVDPIGDGDARVVRARDAAHRALSPAPSASAVPIPTPTVTMPRVTPTTLPTSTSAPRAPRGTTPSSGSL